jgi:hypothetical protein
MHVDSPDKSRLSPACGLSPVFVMFGAGSRIVPVLVSGPVTS